MSDLLQPELNFEYFRILSSAKAWITIVLLPLVALLPDIALVLLSKLFFPTPTDAVMRIQKNHPRYRYEGFDDVFIPGLPKPDEGIEEESEQSK